MNKINEFLQKVPRVIFFIFFSAVILRLFVLGSLLHYGGEQELIWGDTIRYQALAESMLSGSGYIHKGIVDAYRAPGYPSFLLIVGALNIPLWAASFFQIVVSSLIPVALYYIARRHLTFSKKWATVTALIAAFEPLQIYFSVVLLPDVFFSVFFLGGLLLLCRWLEVQSVRSIIWAGVLIGIANYIRPAGIYFSLAIILFFGLYMWRHKIPFKKFPHLVVFAATMFAVMSPWYVRNYIEFKKIGFVSAGSYNLYVYGAASTEALATGKTYEETYVTMLKKLKAESPEPSNQWSFRNESYMNDASKKIILSHPLIFTKTYLAGLNNFLFSGMYHSLLARYQLIKVPEKISFSFFLNQQGIKATIEKFSSLITTPYFFLAAAGKLFWAIVILSSLVGAWLYRKTPLAFLFFITMLYFIFTAISVTIGAEARHRYVLNPMIFLFFTAFLSMLDTRYKRS